MSRHCIILSTVDDPEAARRIARSLVEERLAACVSIIPGVESIYRWRGEIEQARESQLVIKTTRAASDALIARLQELHPYDVPEIVRLPIDGGNPAYLQWLDTNVGDDS